MSPFKYSFANDYSELAHPQVLAALQAAGDRQFDGYGLDEYCLRAADLIRNTINQPQAEVQFASGGTQSNLIVLSAMLRSHQSVIAASLGHIASNETGAIEATGHKVSVVEKPDAKLNAADIEAVLAAHQNEHHVKPAAVYISQSNELGSIYTRGELRQLSECCKSNGLYLYVDGARLGAALNSSASDLGYAELAQLADAFYIGGTKNGAIYGEAIVITNDELKPDFRYHLKQRGALLGKTAGMGIQFEALFADGLYDRLASQANTQAARMARGIAELGYRFLSPPQTNMLFVVLPADVQARLSQLYNYHDMGPNPDGVVIRLVTSWATPPEIVEEFLADLAAL